MSDLTHVITRLKNHSLDPIELARLADLWQPDVHPPFVEFLAAHAGTAEFAPEQSEQVTPPDEGDLPHPADSTIDGPPAAPVVPTAGTRGGRYAITTEHRSGGLGTVWRAWDPVLGREVALKTVRPGQHGPPTPSQFTRFVREARTAGRLEHPCIVPVYDLVERDAAGPCYVMRFVSGRTLSEAGSAYHRAREAGTAEPLELAMLLDAFVAVCRAVAYAHSRGVLHRDLKGQNVVLGEFGEVFLVDWGLAKATADAGLSGPAGAAGSATDTGPETALGSLVGTPAYMAVEVALGHPADRRSEVYSLGAMLYQLLAGRAPYEGPDLKAVVNAVVAGEPPPVRSVNPAAPPALASVCEAAMRREPTKRYASADALALDVKRWLAGEPVLAHRERFPARAARWANRHRTGVGVGLAVLLTAVGGLSVSTALLAEEQRKTAANGRLARESAADALGLVQLVEPVLASTRTLHDLRKGTLRSSARAFRQHLTDTPDADPHTRFQAMTVLLYAANVARQEGDAAAAAADYAEAEGLGRRLVADAADVPQYADQYAAVVRNRGVYEARYGTQAAADRLLAQALDLIPPTDGSAAARRNRAAATLNRAAVQEAMGREEAAAGYATAAAAFRELAAEPPADRRPYDAILRIHALAGVCRHARRGGQAKQAENAYREAFGLFDEVNKAAALQVNRADAAFATAVARLEHAQNRLTANPADPKGLESLDNVVNGLRQLRDGYPWVVGFASELADAYRIRAERRPAAGQPGAAADLEAARQLYADLLRLYPAPVWRGQLGRVCAAEADLGGPLAASSAEQAVAALAAALAADPDLADARAAIDRLRPAGR